jgi:GNAT superfamily N-acetyltransferase
MSEYVIKPLDASTWDAFARLAEKHNGMGFGGCWCTWFHSREGRPEGEKGRPWKERLVREGDAHAALVFDGNAAVAWCQFGSPEELPNIHHRKDYEANRTEELPDYRLTCIFVDRDYRRKGVAGVALRGALDLIAQAGGGVVEGYPQDTQGKKISAKFLYNTTRSLYEQTGFTYVRPKGKNHCVMRRTVSPALVRVAGSVRWILASAGSRAAPRHVKGHSRTLAHEGGLSLVSAGRSPLLCHAAIRRLPSAKLHPQPRRIR